MVDQKRYSAVRARCIALRVLYCMSCIEAHARNKSPLLPWLWKSSFAGRKAPDVGAGLERAPGCLCTCFETESKPLVRLTHSPARMRAAEGAVLPGWTGNKTWHYVRPRTALDLVFLQFTRQKIFGRGRLWILPCNKKSLWKTLLCWFSGKTFTFQIWAKLWDSLFS